MGVGGGGLVGVGCGGEVGVGCGRCRVWVCGCVVL